MVEAYNWYELPSHYRMRCDNQARGWQKTLSTHHSFTETEYLMYSQPLSPYHRIPSVGGFIGGDNHQEPAAINITRA